MPRALKRDPVQSILYKSIHGFMNKKYIKVSGGLKVNEGNVDYNSRRYGRRMPHI